MVTYRLKVGIEDLLRDVVEGGNLVRLLTTCLLPGRLMRRVMANLRVEDAFESCCFSSDGGPKKPQAEAFRYVGEGPFSTRLMVGDDRELDLDPARALGWETVEVRLGREQDAWDEVREKAALRSPIATRRHHAVPVLRNWT